VGAGGGFAPLLLLLLLLLLLDGSHTYGGSIGKRAADPPYSSFVIASLG
jgi:hypothetical protein